MKVWKATGDRNTELADLDRQDVTPSCVKLKMLAAELGAHETVAYAAGGGMVIGRNGVGMVTETGEDVTALKRGDIVYIKPVSSCGECSHCRAGKRRECERSYTYGKTEDGVMRDFMVVPASDAILLPKKIAPTEGIFIEAVAMAVEALDAVKVEKGEHIVIIGATQVGLIMAQAALYYQAIPILVDVRADRLDLARRLGIYYTINTVDTDPVKKIFSITCGKMAETMAYCLLSGMPVQRSFECLSRFGRAAFVGLADVKETLSLNFMPLLEKNISIASVAGAEDNYLTAVNMLASRSVDVEALISRKIKFDAVGETLKEIDADKTKYLTVAVEIDKL